MRRAIIAGLLPAITVLAALVPAAAAQAVTSCPAFSEDVLANNQQTTPVAEGTLLPGGYTAHNASLTTGRYVVSITAGATTMVRNESGPNWFTFDPTPTVPGAVWTGTAIDTGNNVNQFGPVSRAALQAAGTPVSQLTFTSGLLILRVVYNPAVSVIPYVISFSLSGRQEDGCALLAG